MRPSVPPVVALADGVPPRETVAQISAFAEALGVRTAELTDLPGATLLPSADGWVRFAVDATEDAGKEKADELRKKVDGFEFKLAQHEIEHRHKAGAELLKGA